NSTPIPQMDLSPLSEPRAYWQSLNAASRLGLVLYWLNFTILDKTLAQVFTLILATITPY
ncbi:hypothetical protein CALCODRAFT_442365, partial [Calocera cornea HHB12733]